MVLVSCDASYKDGWAGIAYHSERLGGDTQLVECNSSSEGELRALLLAMDAAERAGIHHVTFQTDCQSAAQPDHGGSQYLRPLREGVSRYLASQPGWRLEQITRVENGLANLRARQARRSLGDVTVTVGIDLAAAVIELAGIKETSARRWRVAPDRDTSSATVALSAALALLAANPPNNRREEKPDA